MPKTEHVPVRTCAGCGARNLKGEMIRVCSGAGGRVFVDSSGRSAGRGGYVCPATGCVAGARRRDSLSRVLRTSVPADVYDELERLAGE